MMWTDLRPACMGGLLFVLSTFFARSSWRGWRAGGWMGAGRKGPCAWLLTEDRYAGGYSTPLKIALKTLPAACS
eukprot:5855494-Prymnesium_polylepis.1